MSRPQPDQADGLRRLLTVPPPRVIAVAGMTQGAGTTAIAMNLSAALREQGRPVLLLDEQVSSAQSACSLWAVEPHGALADAASGPLGGDAAAAQAACGIRVLPVAGGLAEDGFDVRSLCPAGVVVIDAAFGAAGQLSALARQADELVIVMQPVPASITQTYAGLKRLHRAYAIETFRFLLNGVTSAGQAQRIMANIIETASRYLAVSLQAAGWVRFDPLLQAATRLKQPVAQAYPNSPAAEDFRRLALEIGSWPAPAPASAARACEPSVAGPSAGAARAVGAAPSPIAA